MQTRTWVRPALSAAKFLAFATVVFGGLYLLVLFALGQVLFPFTSNGSMMAAPQGNVSLLVGENDHNPAHLWGRMQKQQAIQDSNGKWVVLGVPANEDPNSADYQNQKSERIQAMLEANPDAIGEVPQELVTYSASGCDPDISLDAALWQIPRIANAKGVSEAQVRHIIDECVNPSLMAKRTVSVTRVNLALDALND